MKALIAHLISMMMIEKSIMLGHTYHIGVECIYRARMYGVELIED